MITRRFRVCAIVWALILFAGISSVSAQSLASVNEILDRIVARERDLTDSLNQYSPLVETYIQNLGPDPELGTVPKSDKYFLGKLNFSKGLSRDEFRGERGFAQGLRDSLSMLQSVKFLPNGFAQTIMIDAKNFDRSHYDFEYIRSEFLGGVRCLVFDVTPKDKKAPGAFIGRIWAEDRDYQIVRFNGTFTEPQVSKVYFHFDSWREQMGPRLWLPAYVYGEESDLRYGLKGSKLHFKAQTRLWGYNVGRSTAQNEFTSLTVDSGRVEDFGDAVEHSSPVLSLRAWERQAEENVIQRMEKAGLLSPVGEVDKVLETVVNNLEVTNDLSIEPQIRCRIMLTSPLESFTVGHTIILSRGMIDVLPDEASLAMILAHELAHIALGHRLDTKYAFNDRLIFEDPDTFGHLSVKRDEREEKQADQKAVEILGKSPYQDKLASAGLFLRAVSDQSKQLPSLLRGHLGNSLASGGGVLRMPGLMQTAPRLERGRIDQVAALPLGGRVRVDPWDNTVELVKTKPVSLQSAGEKMQFEITPVFLYLNRQEEAAADSARSRN